MKGKILSINISNKQGEKKKAVECATLIEDYGIEGDAHAGEKVRQVSILLIYDIQRMGRAGLEVGFGDFAENLTIAGFENFSFKIGDRLRIKDVILEVTQIGKECHSRCKIFEQAGYCIMPESGIFAKIIKGGEIKTGDIVEKL